MPSGGRLENEEVIKAPNHWAVIDGNAEEDGGEGGARRHRSSGGGSEAE